MERLNWNELFLVLCFFLAEKNKWKYSNIIFVNFIPEFLIAVQMNQTTVNRIK